MRGRLLGSAIAFGLYALAVALPGYVTISPDFHRQIDLVAPLLLAFGFINALVAVAVNPWKLDRSPDRFPHIVQDALVIALFAVVATVILQEKIFATTAVGAVVVGFALQDTLGNLFAGLAIQIEKPFRVGQWVRIAGHDGAVTAITWRATKIRTKAGNLVIVPNSTLSKDTITNYSEPSPLTRLDVEVGASYHDAPGDVKSAILDALEREPLVARDPPPEVIVVGFAGSSISYKVRVWTNDFGVDDAVTDRVRSLVYHAFLRRGVVMPYPIEWRLERTDDPYARALDDAPAIRAMDAVEIFSSLEPAFRDELRRSARLVHYLAGEAIVRQGASGSSMFVIVRGEARVTLEPDQHEVARLSANGFFGEMSLLTGEPRTATVTAVTPCDVMEITADAFRTFVMAHPASVELIGVATAHRATHLERVRSASAAAGRTDVTPAPLVARIRRFLGLGV